MKLVTILVGVFFVFLPAFALADGVSHPGTMIIPTKYRFLLLDMADSVEKEKQPIAPVIQSEDNAVSGALTQKPVDNTEEILAVFSDLAPKPSYQGMGRGYVETNFDVSFTEPGRKIDNRERFTARGLFNVHVAHGFN
jgi:hypothetical protein